MRGSLAAFLVLAWLGSFKDARVDETSRPSVADVVSNDRTRIQGTWRAVSTTLEGRENPGAHGTLFTFSGDTLTIKNERLKDGIHATFRLDETKTPKEIDWSGQFMGKAFVVRAIYRFEGKTLVYCAAQQLDANAPPPARPREFKTVAGDGRTLNRLRRVRKTEKEP